jgi:hypothetical protein
VRLAVGSSTAGSGTAAGDGVVVCTAFFVNTTVRESGYDMIISDRGVGIERSAVAAVAVLCDGFGLWPRFACRPPPPTKNPCPKTIAFPPIAR